jgi:hypothetical protein
MTGVPNVAERKALLWYRVNGPSADYQRDMPPLAMRMRLLHRGWLHMAPTRKRGDPMAFELSDEGKKALDNELPKPRARSDLED